VKAAEQALGNASLTFTITVPAEALRPLVAQVVAEILERMPTTHPAPIPPADAEQTPQLLTRRQAAQWLGVSQSTVDNMARDGRLKPIHIGRSVRFPVAELERFVSSL